MSYRLRDRILLGLNFCKVFIKPDVHALAVAYLPGEHTTIIMCPYAFKSWIWFVVAFGNKGSAISS